MERSESAVERKHEIGCNCCQAVLLEFAPEIKERCADCNEEKLLALGSGFGSGMGNMEATCGALVGAGMVVGLLGGNRRNLSPEFKERVGALKCAEIKGVKFDSLTGKLVHGKVLCSCDNCVRHAVQIAENAISEI